MAKEDKKNSEKKIGRNAQDEGFKYGVKELAKELDLEQASVRVKLRNLGIDKNGAVYGWKNDRDFDAVIKQMKSAGRSEKSDKDSKSDKGGKNTKAKSKSKPEKKDRRDEGEGAEA